MDYFNIVCEVLELEGEFMKVSYVKHKMVEVNMINIAKIASLELVED